MAETSGDAGEFGARLRAWRFSAGLSQGELADLCGLSERAIRNLERGRARSPHPDSVRRLADALDLPGPRAEFIAAARQHRLPQAAGATAGERLAGKGPPARVGGAVPRQLPHAVPVFTGRSSELAALTDALTRPGRTVVITAIGGTAGVGKTALAVHWAHQMAGRFPDGQLYVNLRGFDPGQPVPPEDALAGFLRSLGVPGQEIPSDREERAARYRSLVAGRRMLIVVDNAGSADQVRPLLPGTESCAVVVTSRDALAGLVARDGACRLDLDVLSLPEAVALLRALIGDRVDADLAAAAVLAGQCCRLPLALRVAAELAVSRPAIPLAALTGELTDLSTRLDLLGAGGDPGTEARTVFSWSCRYLDAGTARVFGLLGWHPGPGFDSWATAALAGVTAADEAGGTLGLLARAHLVQPVSPGRYGMHDLLRSYACELAGGREPQAALTRLLDYYLHTAAAAMDVLFPAERHRRPRIPEPATPVPALADAAAARDWLDSELGALVAAARHAAECGWPDHAIRLALTLDRYLRIGGHFPEALTVFGHALDAARRAGDRAAEAAALCKIGQVDAELGRPQPAADRYRQALGLFRVAEDQAGEALALSNLGIAEVGLSRYEEAARYQQEAVAIFRDIGERFGQARALGNLGLARERQGRYQEAAGYQGQALELSREAGDPQGEAFALARLGVVDLRLGRYPEAARYLERAMAQFAAVGDTASVCEVLVKLGDVYAGLGRHEQAAGSFERVAALSREIGHPAQEADALNCLGDLLLQKGEHSQASARYSAAVLLASQAGAAAEQARAQDGVARTRLAAAHVSDHDGHGPPTGEAPG